MENIEATLKKTLLLFAAMLVLPNIAEAAKSYGVVRLAKGQVLVKKAHSENLKRLRIGQKVYPGDSIVTKSDSRAKIVMIDNNVINVSPNTFFTIKSYDYDPSKFDKNVSLSVLFGKIRTSVKQRYDGKDSKFIVKTPTAVAGVRGTDFLTAYDSSTNSTKIITFEGAVSFKKVDRTGNSKKYKPVTIAAGQFSTNKFNAEPTVPKALPKVELVKIEKATELQAPSGAKPEAREPANTGSSQPNRNPDSVDHKGSTPKHSPVFSEEDLGNDGNVAAPSVGPELDLPGPPPTLVEAPPVEACQFCNRVIEDGNTRVLINLVPDFN